MRNKELIFNTQDGIYHYFFLINRQVMEIKYNHEFVIHSVILRVWWKFEQTYLINFKQIKIVGLFPLPCTVKLRK